MLLKTRSFGLLKRAPSKRSGERRELGLRLRQGRVHHGDPAVAVLGKHKTALVIQGEPVGARLAAAWHVARVPRRRQVRLRALSLLPPVDGVLQDVGEQQEAAVLDPDRPFGPFVSFGEDLDLGVGREQFVERRVEALDTGGLGAFCFAASPCDGAMTVGVDG